MKFLDETLTNDQKLRLMNLAIRPRQAFTGGYESTYKKMVDLVVNYNPKPEKKATITIDIKDFANKVTEAVRVSENDDIS